MPSPPGAAPMMYQTPQGVVYAAAPSGMNLPEGYVLNLPQTPTLAIPQPQAVAGQDGQQAATGQCQVIRTCTVLPNIQGHGLIAEGVIIIQT